MHIYIPLDGKYSYDQSQMFARIIVNIVHKQIPDYTSLERMVANRKGKMYLDFLQNRQGQTLAAPYSARPTEAASVSTPLHWDEVKKGLDPFNFTIKNIFKRLDRVGELWSPVLGKGIDVTKVLKAIS